MNPPTAQQFGSPFELELPPPPQPVIPGIFPGPPHIPLIKEWIEPEPEKAPATPPHKKRKSSK